MAKKRSPFFQKAPDTFIDITLDVVKKDNDPLHPKHRKHVDNFEFHLDPKKIGTKGKGIP